MKIIQHQELGSTQASITFSSIPQTYTDLYVLLSVRSNDTSVSAGYDPFLYRLNASTSGYSGRQIWGDGASSGQATEATRTSTAATGTWGRLSNAGVNNANSTSSTFSSVGIYLPNYTLSIAKNVSCEFVSENNGTTAFQEAIAHLWTGTDAITSVAVALGLGSFVQYSSATLYGITKGSNGVVVS
jgi:hypothetical protein